jgi:threonyl-tRNA synthetase
MEYAKEFENLLKENNIRAEIDLSSDSFGKKIRNAKLEKIPYLAVIGKKEVESNCVTLESRTGSLGALSKDEILKKLLEETKERR